MCSIVFLTCISEIPAEIKLLFRSPLKHSSANKEACEMCGQECESRATLQHHLLLQHNILNSFLNSFNLLSPLGQLQSQQQSQKQQNNQGNDADRTRNSMAVPGMVTSPISVVCFYFCFFFLLLFFVFFFFC